MNPAITAFLRNERIAVVGVSRTKGFANSALRALRRAGYQAFAVNDQADEVEGGPCFRSLDAIPGGVGAALVVVSPARASGVVADCARLGIRHVWLQQGAESEEALRFAAESGLSCVSRECILMYAQPRGIHRLHRWVHERRNARALRSSARGTVR